MKLMIYGAPQRNIVLLSELLKVFVGLDQNYLKNLCF